MKGHDLTGKKFERLTVIKYVGTNKYHRNLWSCKCDCGNDTVVDSGSLLKGLTRSCGCLLKEYQQSGQAHRIHGGHGTRLYRIWKDMKNRCNNPNCNDYQKWYGSRGIRVCDEWNNSFILFREWALSNGYNDKLSIDRINVDGNYCPENCRWATPLEQAHNRRESSCATKMDLVQ